MLAVPGQAAGVRRPRRQWPPTLGSRVALQIWANEGRGAPRGCGRMWKGRNGHRVPVGMEKGGDRERERELVSLMRITRTEK